MLPINETMGQYSELFMLLAAGTYTIAFIAFAWDLAKSSKMLRAVDLKAAELSAAASAEAARVPAGVGAGSADRTESHLSGPAGRTERPTSAAAARGQGAGRCAPTRRGHPALAAVHPWGCSWHSL